MRPSQIPEAVPAPSILYGLPEFRRWVYDATSGSHGQSGLQIINFVVGAGRGSSGRLRISWLMKSRMSFATVSSRRGTHVWSGAKTKARSSKHPVRMSRE